MTDFPRSLMEFQQRFPDEDGRLRPKAHTHDCADCRKQASVTAGTVMHGSKLVLTAWFWTAHLMATHSNGISALQLQKQLCLGSYKTAWLLATKVRRAMGAPRRMPLAGLVEVDESLIASPSKDNPPSGGGRRSRQGKLLVADAVEVGEGGSDRIRLAQLEDFSADSLHAFLGVNLATGAIARTDGWAGYPDESGVIHDPHIGGNMAPISSCLWVHRVFANLKTCSLDVYGGLRRQRLQSDLDEFVFRFSRGHHTRHAAFRSILGIGLVIKPATYRILIAPEERLCCSLFAIQ